MTTNFPNNPWYPPGGTAVEPDELPAVRIGAFIDPRQDQARQLAAQVVEFHAYDIADELLGHVSGEAVEAVSPALVDRMTKYLIEKLNKLAALEGVNLE